MTGSPDYLFDPAAEPDPEVLALERALAPLAWRAAPPRASVPPPLARRPRWPWLVAALLLVSVVVVAWPRDGDELVPNAAQRTFLAKVDELRIPLGDLAEITLRPGSVLDFRHWRADEALFALRSGSLEARVAPPPKVQAGFFRVETKAGVVVDQGCRYELVVRDDGGAHVAVVEGAVTFEGRDRNVFVPAGAGTDVTGDGPMTPVFGGSAPDLVKAVREYDELRAKGVGLEERGITIKMVLAAARSPRDSLVLWHLLRDPEPEFRKVAEAHLLDLVGPPDGGKTKADTFDAEEWLSHLRLAVWHAGG